MYSARGRTYVHDLYCVNDAVEFFRGSQGSSYRHSLYRLSTELICRMNYIPQPPLSDYPRAPRSRAINSNMMRALGNNRVRNYSDVTLKSNAEILLHVADKAHVRLVRS